MFFISIDDFLLRTLGKFILTGNYPKMCSFSHLKIIFKGIYFSNRYFKLNIKHV